MWVSKEKKYIYQDKYYSPKEASQIYHPPKPENFPERQMFDPPQRVIHQPQNNHSKKVHLEFPEGQGHFGTRIQ